MQCGGKICQYVVEHVACSCCPSLVYMVWLESVYSLKTVITLSAPCALTTMLHLQSWLYPGFHKFVIFEHCRACICKCFELVRVHDVSSTLER